MMSLGDLDGVWTQSWDVTFRDPLRELWFLLPVEGCPFPQAGRYQMELAVNEELAAQTVLRVIKV
jgi:hypothetical protein